MCVVQDVITINVQPGWKDGTRITFAGKGDELPGQPPQVPTQAYKQLALIFCLYARKPWSAIMLWKGTAPRKGRICAGDSVWADACTCIGPCRA